MKSGEYLLEVSRTPLIVQDDMKIKGVVYPTYGHLYLNGRPLIYTSPVSDPFPFMNILHLDYSSTVYKFSWQHRLSPGDELKNDITSEPRLLDKDPKYVLLVETITSDDEKYDGWRSFIYQKKFRIPRSECLDKSDGSCIINLRWNPFEEAHMVYPGFMEKIVLNVWLEPASDEGATLRRFDLTNVYLRTLLVESINVIGTYGELLVTPFPIILREPISTDYSSVIEMDLMFNELPPKPSDSEGERHIHVDLILEYLIDEYERSYNEKYEFMKSVLRRALNVV